MKKEPVAGARNVETTSFEHETSDLVDLLWMWGVLLLLPCWNVSEDQESACACTCVRSYAFTAALKVLTFWLYGPQSRQWKCDFSEVIGRCHSSSKNLICFGLDMISENTLCLHTGLPWTWEQRSFGSHLRILRDWELPLLRDFPLAMQMDSWKHVNMAKCRPNKTRMLSVLISA